MGEWHKVRGYLYKKGSCPCNDCQVGSADYSQKIIDGKLYEKFDYCQETCKRYKDWQEKEEQGVETS